MRITVKISDIEVIVDRPNFKEVQHVDQDSKLFKEAILPLLKETVEKVQELYKLKKENIL